MTEDKPKKPSSAWIEDWKTYKPSDFVSAPNPRVGPKKKRAPKFTFQKPAEEVHDAVKRWAHVNEGQE